MAIVTQALVPLNDSAAPYLPLAVQLAFEISDVPLCALLRTTSDHARPAPVRFVTIAVVPLVASVATKAGSNSFGAAVENAGDAVVAAVVRSADVLTSMVTAAAAVTR